jgi:cation diffusion facilitator family transporter
LTDFLLKKFVKGYGEGKDEAVRSRVGMLAGGLGIALNLMLFAMKLAIGILSGSVAILSDAFNNISDTGSSVVALIGMRVAARRPDREHPFGHGRAEYVSALIVAMMILLVAVELLKESITKLFSPEPVAVSLPMLLALGASILVKLFMYGYNRALGKRIDSSVLMAAASDSRNDVIVTGMIIVSALAGTYLGWRVDAPVGILVSIFIFYGGVKIAKDVITRILGGEPDPELVTKITAIVRAGEGIVGVHDLIVHDYGPGRRMASVHAEVDERADIRTIHESIDAAERKIHKELGVPVVIHMDPVALHCDRTNRVRAEIENVLTRVNSRFTMHDFQIAEDGEAVNLIFDLSVPGEMPEDAREAALVQIEQAASELDPHYHLVVQVDSHYDL